MRFASLGSGSRGNALVVETGATRILLDCGFGPRELARRLARLGLGVADLAAVVLTHEHSDHVAGALPLAARHGLPLHLTGGTHAGLKTAPPPGVPVRLVRAGEAFAIGGLECMPFAVPHDAREPVQYVFSDGARRLGVATDFGCVTDGVRAALAGCDALVLECNHDREMLRSGPYPVFLKRRVGGDFGHLDNAAAAALVAELADRGRLQHVVAAHLSEKNNRVALAQAALAGALGCEPEWIGVADQADGFGWRGIN